MKSEQPIRKVSASLSPLEKGISLLLQILAGGLLGFIFLWIIWLA